MVCKSVTCDALVIHLRSSELDSPTRRGWEHSFTKSETGKSGNLSTYAEITSLLTEKCRLLESLDLTDDKYG